MIHRTEADRIRGEGDGGIRSFQESEREDEKRLD